MHCSADSSERIPWGKRAGKTKHYHEYIYVCEHACRHTHKDRGACKQLQQTPKATYAVALQIWWYCIKEYLIIIMRTVYYSVKNIILLC